MKTVTRMACALVIIAMVLSASVFVPVALAKPEQASRRLEITWVVNEPYHKEAWVRVDVDGETQDFLISARVHSGRIRIESINGGRTHTNFVELLVWLPRPPYPWWVWIGSVPAFHIYLDPATAMNTATALAVLTFFLGILAGLSGGIALVALLVIGLIALDYAIMYERDKNSNNSFDVWFPYDWYNVLCATLSKFVYAATPRYWWIVTVGAWIVGTR